MDIEYNHFVCSVDENKIYALPSDITLIHRYGFWLYISPQNGSWIVAYSARTAHPFQRNGAPFRFKLSKAQQVY